MNLEDLGWIGIWLLIVSGVAIVIEGVLAGLWSVRIARHSRELNDRLTSERANLEADVERLRMTLEEMKVLWQPYRRLLRWLSHPLAIALAQSFVRRRVAK